MLVQRFPTKLGSQLYTQTVAEKKRCDCHLQVLVSLEVKEMASVSVVVCQNVVWLLQWQGPIEHEKDVW